MKKKSLNLKEILSEVQDFLGLGSKTLWGLDIGGSSVKIAALSKLSGERYKLINYASVKLPEGTIIESEIHDPDALGKAIKECIRKSGVSGNQVCLGLSGSGTVARRLQLAGGSEEEIEDQLTWEAEQYLPFPLEECKYSFYVMGENEGGGVDVIVGAARNELIDNAASVLKGIGLKVKVVDLGILALTNVFDVVASKEVEFEGQSWVILDIGSESSQMIIHKNGMIVFSKEITIGGVMITEEIQRQIGVNYQEAEELKTGGDGKGNLPEEIVGIVQEIVELFIREIKKTIDFYITSTSDDSIVGAYLTGGGSLILGIEEKIAEEMGLEVHRLQPFNVIEYDKKKLSKEDILEVEARGGVALGLGMRSIQ